MLALDRFSQGMHDLQDIAPLACCDGCGQEIYPGEEVWMVEDAIVHADNECLRQRYSPVAVTIEEALGG